MLIDVYPRHVIEFLATHGTGAVPEAVAQLAHSHTGISIFFMDVVGFTPMSKDADPQDVMKMLNELFSAFDILCDKHDVYKVIRQLCACISVILSGWALIHTQPL